MTEQEIEAIARAAGLDKALKEFHDDVSAAAKQAEDLRRALVKPLGPADEPWPPMRIPDPK